MNTTATPQPRPEVGMGATLCYPSDRYPYTVVEVSASGKRIKVTRDDFTRTDNNGQSESQTYDYTTDPTGILIEFSLRKNGFYHLIGESTNSAYLTVGQRRAYFCPSL